MNIAPTTTELLESGDGMEIKQYCRYCNHLHTGNGIWCDAKEKELSESTAKSVNHCKLFLFNGMDAFFENTEGYKPRQPYNPRQPDIDEIAENQICMDGV